MSWMAVARKVEMAMQNLPHKNPGGRRGQERRQREERTAVTMVETGPRPLNANPGIVTAVWFAADTALPQRDGRS